MPENIPTSHRQLEPSRETLSFWERRSAPRPLLYKKASVAPGLTSTFWRLKSPYVKGNEIRF